MNLLLRMRHGLGDNAQFTIVMRHIQHYFPDWVVDMEVGRGKQSYFKNSANKIFLRWRKSEPPAPEDVYDTRTYENLLDVDWPTPECCSEDVPSTKPTAFIKNYLHVEPVEDFYKGYDVSITSDEMRLADNYVKTLPDRPFVIIHYLAKTLKFAKSLTHADAMFICKQVLKRKCTPVILDWKSESPLPDQRTIFNPGCDDPIWGGEKLSSAGAIAALINKAKLYIGVDSGPLHVAGCTKTPTLAIWHGHHPINFYDLCDNVTHLVPAVAKGLKYIKGKNKAVGRDYFEQSYNHIYYKHLGRELIEQIRQELK